MAAAWELHDDAARSALNQVAKQGESHKRGGWRHAAELFRKGCRNSTVLKCSAPMRRQKKRQKERRHGEWQMSSGERQAQRRTKSSKRRLNRVLWLENSANAVAANWIVTVSASRGC
jgi:hypothetical protein